MRNRIVLFVILGLLCSGCGKKMPEPTLMTVPEPEPTVTESVLQETHPDTPEYYIRYVYPLQLREYYSGLVSRWPAEEYILRDRSPLGAAYLQGDPLENVGFLLEDLDGDGSRELLIGAIRGKEEDPLIFELWTAPEEEPELVLRAGEGERYFLMEGLPVQFARELPEEPTLRRAVFRNGTLTASDTQSKPGSYRSPRYYPFFLYAP